MKGLNTLIRSVDSKSAKAKFPSLGAHCTSANHSTVRYPLFLHGVPSGRPGRDQEGFDASRECREKTIPQLFSLVLQEENEIADPAPLPAALGI